MLKTEEYLVETADRCIRLAREGRQLVERLEAISNEMMAKAVELDTARDKNQKPAGKSGQEHPRPSCRVSTWLPTKSPAIAPGFLRFKGKSTA